MFSEAISSISSRWRPSSFAITSAISGSASARVAEKNASSFAATASVADIKPIPHEFGCVGRDSISAPRRQVWGHTWDYPRYILGLRRLARESRLQLPKREALENRLRGARWPDHGDFHAGHGIDRH